MRDYPLTLGHKRNQLMQLASGEIIAHMDDDNIYCPGYVTALVGALRASRSQLARLCSAYCWDPFADVHKHHNDLGGRAETFVHIRGPLRAIAFSHDNCGEEDGVCSVCVCHDVHDHYGIFLHVNHGKNVSAYEKAMQKPGKNVMRA